MGCKFNFLEGHYSKCLSKELGLNNPCHSFQVFVGFSFVFVKGDCSFLFIIYFPLFSCYCYYYFFFVFVCAINFFLYDFFPLILVVILVFFSSFVSFFSSIVTFYSSFISSSFFPFSFFKHLFFFQSPHCTCCHCLLHYS
jgi:hypothetical protein